MSAPLELSASCADRPDAQVGWKPIADRQQLEVVPVGRNLTDSTQRNSVALNKDEVVLPGRDVRLLLRASF